MSALDLREPIKRILARCIVNVDCQAEAYHRLGIAVMDGHFDADEAATIGKLIDLMHERRRRENNLALPALRG